MLGARTVRGHQAPLGQGVCLTPHPRGFWPDRVPLAFLDLLGLQVAAPACPALAQAPNLCLLPRPWSLLHSHYLRLQRVKWGPTAAA